jgi:hypothetical protein
MKKTVYFWLIVILLLTSTLGIILSYYYKTPGFGAMCCGVWIVALTALGLMPDEDKYQEINDRY